MRLISTGLTGERRETIGGREEEKWYSIKQLSSAFLLGKLRYGAGNR